MGTIELAGGHVALVDDEDFERVSRYRWCRARGYAQHALYVPGSGARGKRRTLLMHRIVMDAQPGQMVDHIDGDKLNNQKANLRFCTMSQNLANSRRHGRFKSDYECVHPHGRKWRAQIMVNGVMRRLGSFSTEIHAARAYALAAVEMFGDFAHSEIIPNDKLLESGLDN